MILYSRIPLNGHPLTADTCNITNISECLDPMSIQFVILLVIANVTGTIKTQSVRVPLP